MKARDTKWLIVIYAVATLAITTSASAQLTDSVASVGDGGSGSNLCLNQQSGNFPTNVVCSGVATSGSTSGTAGSSAASTYGVLSAGAGVTIVGDGHGALNMQSEGEAEIEDLVSIENLTQNAFLQVTTAMGAVGGNSGGLTTSLVLLQVNITDNLHAGGCVIQTFGQNACTATVPIPANPSGLADLNVLLAAEAGANYQNNGTGASAFVSVGQSANSGARVIAMMVVDANGNPIPGVTLTALSGHIYPSLFPSFTALVSSQNPSHQGQPVTFTATVSSLGRQSSPTGTVTFRDTTFSTILGTVQLNNGVAALTTSGLSSGQHAIVASYSGDNLSSPSNSAAVNQLVQ